MLPFLSITIPTYNRGDIVYKTVVDGLKFDCDELEIVVVDNNSTDNTKELLQKISDTRFRYYRNEQNIGGAANILFSITKARGKYALSMSDEDVICPESITEVINILKAEDGTNVLLGAVINREGQIYNRSMNGKYGVFQSGVDAIRQLVVSCRGYMGGFFYNVENAKKYIEPYTPEELLNRYGKGYNFIYLSCLMLQDGNFFGYEQPVCRQVYEGKMDPKARLATGNAAHSITAHLLFEKQETIPCIRELKLEVKEKMELLTLKLCMCLQDNAVSKNTYLSGAIQEMKTLQLEDTNAYQNLLKEYSSFKSYKVILRIIKEINEETKRQKLFNRSYLKMLLFYPKYMYKLFYTCAEVLYSARMSKIEK